MQNLTIKLPTFPNHMGLEVRVKAENDLGTEISKLSDFSESFGMCYKKFNKKNDVIFKQFKIIACLFFKQSQIHLNM